MCENQTKRLQTNTQRASVSAFREQGLMENVCGVCDVNGEWNPWKEVRLGCLTGQSCVLSELLCGLMVFL